MKSDCVVDLFENCAPEMSLDKLIIVNVEPVDNEISVSCDKAKEPVLEDSVVDVVSDVSEMFEFAAYPVVENDELSINEQLSDEQRRAVREIIVNNYVNRDHIKPIVHDCSMKLNLTNETPFYCLPKQCSPAEKDLIQATIDDLLEQKIIRPSFSPFASRIVMVDKKKTLEKRMCVDYRVLNDRTLRDNYPIPVISDCLEYLEGKQYFTSLDLRSSFHQVNMAEESKKITAFVSPSGCFEYVKMPFGLKNAPGVFQLRDFINQKEIVVYLDDILLATRDVTQISRMAEQHLADLFRIDEEAFNSEATRDESDREFRAYIRS